MELYLGKKSQNENLDNKQDEDVKSDSESKPDTGCTFTAATPLCTKNTVQQIQASEEGTPSTSEMINPCSHLIKSTENKAETQLFFITF